MSYSPYKQVPQTAFGEVNTAENRPFIQAAPLYGLIPSNFREYTSASGTTGVENRMFKVTTGTTIFGYGAIQSFRSVNYKAGEGLLARYTALFESSKSGAVPLMQPAPLASVMHVVWATPSLSNSSVTGSEPL